ncbi:MAG TPA: pitrilysin family protein [Paludibacteraceae bacterium]|jgi:predicted Zn-dependent peptidase|nr:pitrilysin family protein [Paludibacteraceae bacterium]HQF50285.1 pitrilysin family protein [Paludibacteraceae bacterium]
MDKLINTLTLKNGIRVVHKPDASPVSYCGIAINVGTRDEEDDESGMAHFIEHMLFKGTDKRKSWHILNRLENVGGELNAYTTKEETFVYATVLSVDFERAMELCANIVFHSTFPQNEIDKEVDVIIDEINSYNDTPSELIFDDFEDLIFSGSPLGRNILGDADKLRTYRTADALRFVKRNYATDQILFFSLGNVPFKKISQWAERYLGDVPEMHVQSKREKPCLYVPQKKVIDKNTYQAHVIYGNRAYGLSENKRLAFYLLNNILGGPGMNSRLNVALRERSGIAYNIESNYTSYSDSGIVSIYFGTDVKNMEKSCHIVLNELKKLRNNRFSDLQLSKAKKQLICQLAISQESKESLSLSLGKSFLYFDKFESLDDICKSLEEITPSMLMEVANEIFEEDSLSLLKYQ